jgi:hypothetical protein
MKNSNAQCAEPPEPSVTAATKEFFRLPKWGEKDPIFDLPKKTYMQLEKEGAIKLVRVRRPGRTRGSVLVEVKMIREYLAAQVSADRKIGSNHRHQQDR